MVLRWGRQAGRGRCSRGQPSTFDISPCPQMARGKGTDHRTISGALWPPLSDGQQSSTSSGRTQSLSVAGVPAWCWNTPASSRYS
eukprot:scaffold591_cov372-Prasinococcus_capsulatus_cf.AAC.14